MINLNEFIRIINLINNDQIVKSLALFIVLFCMLIAVILSPMSATIIFSSYILGFVVCWCLIRYQRNAAFCLQRFVSFYRIRLASNKFVQQTCNICNENGCNRHAYSSKASPWNKVRINKKLNNAIEHFYIKLLNTFVLSWYDTFTDDTSFINELKFCLRYATANAAIKALELDVGNLIANKFLPCIIRHIDDYLCMQQIAKLKNVDVNKIAVDYLGKRLHIAVTNRENEKNYLKQLSECLLPKLLPEEYLNCSNYTTLLREIITGWVFLPVTDVLADPNIINLFVILAVNAKSHPAVENDEIKEDVALLDDFIKKDTKFSLLASDLKTVLKDNLLLYSFMQFLKREGTVHILQFCLDIEEFNNKLITPDLSKRQLESLHIEAYNIYKIYINCESPDFIGCSEKIADDLNQLLDGGMYNVAKLRTSEPLFQAYDHAFGVLEKDYLPEFYHSNEFYSYLCGSKATAGYKKTSARNRKYYESSSQGTVAKISSGLGKIKGALLLKPPIDGYYTPESYENDATHYTDEVMPHTPVHRDMSMWKVTIQTKAFNYNRSLQIFYVNIECMDTSHDNESRSWTVQRKDNDFFLLKAKLIEFHGETEISESILSSKRNLYNLDADQRRLIYENFIWHLLQKPLLKSSDLLYTFLTSEQNFGEIISAVSGVDFENIYFSVANKLRKERGQHLDSFMNTFLTSIGTAKMSKVEWAELGDEIDCLQDNSSLVPKTYKNKIFGDNYGVTERKLDVTSSGSFNPRGICESLFYLLKHTLKVRYSVLKLYTAICNVCQQPFESLCKVVIERKIKSALSQSNLTILIKLLENLVFEKHTQLTDEELEDRRKHAFQVLENTFPHWLVKTMGKDFKVGVNDLLKILQNPLYNKQLVYNLLDILIAEIYPELDYVQSATK